MPLILDAGSNAFRIATRAVRDGSVYRLRGQKVFITGADVADYMLVVARTTPFDAVRDQGLSKAMGMSLFIVDTKAEGLVSWFSDSSIPTRASPTCSHQRRPHHRSSAWWLREPV